MRVTYRGPHDRVFVPEAGQEVEHGHSIEVDDELGARLLEQEGTWREYHRRSPSAHETTEESNTADEAASEEGNA